LIVASLLTNSLFDPALDGGRFETGLLYLAFLLTQAAVLLLGLWLLRQSFLRRHFPNAGLRWQFSIKYLFVLMTTVALITILLRHVELIREISIPFVAWIVNNAAIAMAVVVIRLAPWHPMLRVGATAWVAAISGAVMAAIAPNGLESLAVNFIQAIVLQLWLELGGVIPQPDATDGTTSSPTPMPSQEA
jgi:hypothetical protein